MDHRGTPQSQKPNLNTTPVPPPRKCRPQINTQTNSNKTSSLSNEVSNSSRDLQTTSQSALDANISSVELNQPTSENYEENAIQTPAFHSTKSTSRYALPAAESISKHEKQSSSQSKPALEEIPFHSSVIPNLEMTLNALPNSQNISHMDAPLNKEPTDTDNDLQGLLAPRTRPTRPTRFLTVSSKPFANNKVDQKPLPKTQTSSSKSTGITSESSNVSAQQSLLPLAPKTPPLPPRKPKVPLSISTGSSKPAITATKPHIPRKPTTLVHSLHGTTVCQLEETSYTESTQPPRTIPVVSERTQVQEQILNSSSQAQNQFQYSTPTFRLVPASLRTPSMRSSCVYDDLEEFDLNPMNQQVVSAAQKPVSQQLNRGLHRPSKPPPPPPLQKNKPVSVIENDPQDTRASEQVLPAEPINDETLEEALVELRVNREPLSKNTRSSHCLAVFALQDDNEISHALKYMSNICEVPSYADIRETAHPSIMSTGHRQFGGHVKSQWKDLEIVEINPLFHSMDLRLRQLHEAKFEIVSSEATYLSLLSTFEEQKQLFPSKGVLTETKRNMLFSRMELVQRCAENYFIDLESCWQKSIFLEGIFDVMLHHVNNNFHVYAKYCIHQAHINSAFTNITSENLARDNLVKSLHSFLILPMQRITRLPLMVEAVLQRLTSEDAEYEACRQTLVSLRKVADECNEDVRKDERISTLLILSKQIEFPKGMVAFPLISVSRWLVRSGTVVLRWHADRRRKPGKSVKHMFLFNDLLIVCKKKSDENYKAVSYCRRSLAEMVPVNLARYPQIAAKSTSDMDDKYFFMIVILANHENQRELMVVSASSSSERDSWFRDVPAITPHDSNEDMAFEPHDCPEVKAILPYTPTSPEHLGLELNDKLHVNKRHRTGWYEGERVTDGQRGLFPVSCTTEMETPHKQAREIRERYVDSLNNVTNEETAAS